MATTTSFTLSGDEYTEVVAGTSNDFLLQNLGWVKCEVVWAASLPADSASGHILLYGGAVVRNGLTGKVYAKAMNGSSVVMVTEE